MGLVARRLQATRLTHDKQQKDTADLLPRVDSEIQSPITSKSETEWKQRTFNIQKMRALFCLLHQCLDELLIRQINHTETI